MGYKITADKSSIVCGLDHEYGISGKSDTNFLDKADNSDLVVWDGMFTHLELKEKHGWGHSSIEQGIDFSSSAKSKLLLITHHSPQREDHELNQLAQQLFPPNVRFAKENEKIKI